MPKAAIDRNCIQLSLSHREMKLHGTIKHGDGRTMRLANEQGMTYVLCHASFILSQSRAAQHPPEHTI